ncbi:hypothetical protein Sulku_1716 [Sulfuricurvum kujiense DSM 16994]|uniref:Uncharacterized protein n=1 Tax=Sulfuricurvum kujiense (strain ATCC BAA-921 / DSM 16994 / JCM 11577 / YK-1) TaxID=709032 RepID=E4U0X5_SULKY|nr:hypothetical protein [Sulfuricurvum kujiense]ADR34377.1 hypothetical protein Sulku_1716 [Sulfuricurvum kujiense DSM 16994]
MNDNPNPLQIEIVHEYIGETAPKSKRLNYERIKELCTEAQYLRVELNKSQTEDITKRLDTFIEELKQLQKSTSKYLDSDEVMSDLEWIVEYIHKEEWINVTRWLSNIDSSIREMWSHYIEQIIKHKKSTEMKNNIDKSV